MSQARFTARLMAPNMALAVQNRPITPMTPKDPPDAPCTAWMFWARSSFGAGEIGLKKVHQLVFE